jgi:hypothetical protein
MDAQVEIFEDVSAFLLGIINNIDRTKTVMINSYPNWDSTDTTEFKILTIDRLNIAIKKLEQL